MLSHATSGASRLKVSNLHDALKRLAHLLHVLAPNGRVRALMLPHGPPLFSQPVPMLRSVMRRLRWRPQLHLPH